MTDANSPGTRKSRKATTRLAVREAAIRCFSKKGFLTTSIADISHEAGVAKGTFYVHYEDKDALLDEVLVEFNDTLAIRLTEVIRAAGSRPLESIIRTIAVIYLEHWTSNSSFVRAFAERSSAGLDLAALPFGINPSVRDLLVSALRRRATNTRAVDAELVLHGLLAMWLRLGLQMVFRPSVEPAHVIDTLVLLTTGALERIFDDRPRPGSTPTPEGASS